MCAMLQHNKGRIAVQNAEENARTHSQMSMKNTAVKNQTCTAACRSEEPNTVHYAMVKSLIHTCHRDDTTRFFFSESKNERPLKQQIAMIAPMPAWHYNNH